MKIIRSSKLRNHFATEKKRQILLSFLEEYRRVVNCYIDLFWIDVPVNTNALIKPLIDKVLETWLAYRVRQQAARQALGICKSVKERPRDKGSKTTPKKPQLRDLKAVLDSHCVELSSGKNDSFDLWLHVHSVGNKLRFDLPFNKNKHYKELDAVGRRMTGVVLTPNYIQVNFELNIETKPKLTTGLGIDTGVSEALAAMSDGRLLGTDIGNYIEEIKRHKHGSNEQRTARRALRHYIDAVAKEVVSTPGLTFVVVEKLTGITKNRKQPGRRRV